MRKVRVSELFDFDKKSKLLAKEGKEHGQYSFYTSSPTLSKFTDNYQYEGERIIFGMGGTPSIHFNNSRFSVSSHCTVLKPAHRELFNSKYVYYYLKTNLQNLLFYGFKGAGLKNISPSYIANLQIPLPSFGEQNRIVTVIDKVVNIANKKRAIINSMSNLVLNDLFLSVFGDVHENPNKWPITNLEQLCDKIIDCPHSTPVYSVDKTDYACLRSSDIQNGFLDFTDTKYVSRREYVKRVKRYVPQPGDIVYCREGARYGIASFIPENCTPCLGQRVMLLSANTIVSNNNFLWALLNSDGVLFQAKNKVGGAGSPHVNIKDIKKFKVINPPKKLQDYYSELVAKAIVIREKSIKELSIIEDLLASVSYSAFIVQNLKTDVRNFNFDDQMVDYIEKEQGSPKIHYATISETFIKLTELIFGLFQNQEFTFDDLVKATRDFGIDIDYEYHPTLKRPGLKDFVFNILSDGDNKPALLRQVFKLDEGRDAEKGTDNSKITFLLNG